MKESTKVIAALLIGAAAGAALGILLAPEKGETTREGITDFVNDLIDTIKDKALSTSGELRERGSNVYERAKSKFRGTVNDMADYKDDAVKSAKKKIENVKGEAHQNYNNAKSKAKSTANDWNNSVQQS